MPALAAILVFSVIILVHELGHFLAAKAVGIEVEEFALGFGPRLVGIHRGGTWYSLRIFPLGGFVKMLGEEEDEKNPSPNSYQNKTVLQRMLVIAAGPVMNFVLALLVFIVIYSAIGVAVADLPKVSELVPNQPAAESGMLPGDLVTHIDGKPIATWEEFVITVQGSQGRPLVMSIQRSGETVELTITPRQNPDGIYAIGVYPEASMQKKPIFTSIRYGFRQTIQVTGAILVNLLQLVTGRLPADDITGPIGIFYIVGQAARVGLVNVLFLGALISINLGLFNLLPVPALDGSKLVFLGIEALRRKPIDPNKENLVHLVGFALLISLMVLVMYRDIVRFFVK